MERFENVLNKYQAQTERACVELARKWRTDKTLRRLESMMVVVDRDHSLLVSGGGDVISPDDGIISIGSGSDSALAAARALVGNTDLSPVEITRRSLRITSRIDVYTNENIDVESPDEDPDAVE
jgi:ATP-dependent HslUV protease subunit HslV